MKRFPLPRRRSVALAVGLATATVGSVVAWPTAATAGRADTIVGTITAISGDGPAGSTAAAELHWVLVDDEGHRVWLDLPEEVLRRAGGLRAVDRRRVVVSGATVLRRPDRISPVRFRADGVRGAAGPAAPSEPPTGAGSRPYALLLCRFADLPGEPREPGFFRDLMGEDYPRMGHYFRTISGGALALTGSQVFGWYGLPRRHAEYFDGIPILESLEQIASDCTAAASGDADWGRFAGIILQVNGPLAAVGEGLAYGGARVAVLGGEPRTWPIMWMPAWATGPSRFGIYAHELGHTLGLPHSAGPDGMYDSTWDVMSRPYLWWDAAHNAWIPGGTIGFHQDLLGWIPPDRKVTVVAGSHATVALASRPTDDASHAFLVEVPIPGSPDHFTVEARVRQGYDRGLVGDAVVVHRVPHPGGPGCTLHGCARVVDRSGRGQANGPGAMWLPGDDFHLGFLTLAVTEATDHGWEVVVSVMTPARPEGLTPDRAAAALLERQVLSSEEQVYLDGLGNDNGHFDLGDLLAFLARYP